MRLRVRSGERAADRFPTNEDALGQALFSMLAKALEMGLPRPAFLVFRPDQIDEIDALPIMRMPVRHGHRMLSAIAGQPGVECVALVAALTLRTGERTGARAGVVFIEWPDNRWWTAWQPLSDERVLLGGEPAVRLAAEGWPKPGGVGGWFATARRLTLRLRMSPVQADGSEPVIH
ncbi:MAG: hypothetical protein GXP62_20150 [Oligoflexia bacterium]|nr:hypothetical protein [Oligoflexia bacterium]